VKADDDIYIRFISGRYEPGIKDEVVYCTGKTSFVTLPLWTYQHLCYWL